MRTGIVQGIGAWVEFRSGRTIPVRKFRAKAKGLDLHGIPSVSHVHLKSRRNTKACPFPTCPFGRSLAIFKHKHMHHN